METHPVPITCAAEIVAPGARPKTRAEVVADDYIYSYENPNSQINVKQSLMSWWEFCIQVGLDPLFGSDIAGPIRRSDVEKFLRWCEQIKGYARRTVAGRFSAVRGFFRRAVMDGHIEKDPTEHMKAPRVERKTTTNDLTKQQLVRVLKAAKKKRPRDFAIMCLLAYNGLRASELVGLRCVDVREEDGGYMTVSVTRKGGNVQTLALSMVTAKAIEAYKGDRTEGPLFESLRCPGKAITRGDLNNLVQRYARACDIPQRVSTHSLRHTFITQALNSGVSQRQVQWAAGHADGRMTSYYDHGSGNRASEATHTLTAYIADLMD